MWKSHNCTLNSYGLAGWKHKIIVINTSGKLTSYIGKCVHLFHRGDTDIAIFYNQSGLSLKTRRQPDNGLLVQPAPLIRMVAHRQHIIISHRSKGHHHAVDSIIKGRLHTSCLTVTVVTPTTSTNSFSPPFMTHCAPTRDSSINDSVLSASANITAYTNVHYLVRTTTTMSSFHNLHTETLCPKLTYALWGRGGSRKYVNGVFSARRTQFRRKGVNHLPGHIFVSIFHDELCAVNMLGSGALTANTKEGFVWMCMWWFQNVCVCVCVKSKH